MRRLLFGAGVLLAIVLQRPAVTANDPRAARQRDVEVEQREGVSSPEQAARAEARGRLALAKGRMQKAAAEFRNLVSYRKAQLEGLKARRGQICDPRTLGDAEGELAIARVLLAEAKEDIEQLEKLLPAVVRYHHHRFLHVERLMLMHAIDPRDARAAMRQLREARQAASARAVAVHRELQRRKAAREEERLKASMQNEMRLQNSPIFLPVPGFPPPVIHDNKFPQ